MLNLSISLLAQLTSELERIHQKRTCAVRREYTEDTDSSRVYIYGTRTANETTRTPHALGIRWKIWNSRSVFLLPKRILYKDFGQNKVFGPYGIDPYKTRALLWQSILIHLQNIFLFYDTCLTKSQEHYQWLQITVGC